MSTTFDQHVEWLADELVTVRDFCGDERECIREYQADRLSGWPRPERLRLANAATLRADELWRAAQRAAGVRRPIQPGERASIERALSD